MISVIMASYLGDYKGAASNREQKFIRAVDSFLYQEFEDKELIIVSDFCDITERIYNEKYKQHSNISLFKLKKKQATFSGSIRTCGLSLAKGEKICYLDTDDFFGKDHLKNINEQFTEEVDWVFYDDFLIPQFTDFDNFTKHVRVNEIMETRIGTSTICHKSSLNETWEDGYGHDWKFIQKLLKYPYKKIYNASYNVCHIPSQFDV